MDMGGEKKESTVNDGVNHPDRKYKRRRRRRWFWESANNIPFPSLGSEPMRYRCKSEAEGNQNVTFLTKLIVTATSDVLPRGLTYVATP